MPKTVTIPLPGNAQAVLSYTAPATPPPSGHDWPPEQDYPGVTVDIRIPRLAGLERIEPQFVDEATVLLGENLSRDWGFNETTPDTGENSPWMCRDYTARASTLRAAEAEACKVADECAETLRKVLDARARRMAQRESIIALAHDRHETITHDGPEA